MDFIVFASDAVRPFVFPLAVFVLGVAFVLLMALFWLIGLHIVRSRMVSEVLIGPWGNLR